MRLDPPFPDKTSASAKTESAHETKGTGKLPRMRTRNDTRRRPPGRPSTRQADSRTRFRPYSLPFASKRATPLASARIDAVTMLASIPTP